VENLTSLEKAVRRVDWVFHLAGVTKAIRKELDPYEPVSFYGRSKCVGEELVLTHAHELPVLIPRPSAA
jgi:dTDP-4-dehydrorhamnose reductase